MKIPKNIEIILLVLILLVAAFLRLYQIRDFIVFLGDQGRDVLVVKQILVDGKLTLLGPTASVGGFYLGPVYYYMMILPLWLAGFDPIGPAIMVALIGVVTVYFIYVFIKQNFGKVSGLFSAFFYAISPLAVTHSRFSWNPNTVPFFTLAYFYFIYLARKKRIPWFLFIAGLMLGICLQLHYLALSLAPLGVILAFSKRWQKWALNTGSLVLGTLISFSPFLAFEVRHGFGNLRSILEFVTRRGGAIGFYPFSLLDRLSELNRRIFANFYGMEKNFLITLVFLGSLILLITKLFKKKTKWASAVLLVWWLGGIFILSFYQGTIYNYYYGYLYPIPAIALGLSFAYLAQRKFLFSKLLAGVLPLVFIFSAWQAQPFLQPANKVLEQTERISQTVVEKTEGKPFNFALISSGNSDHAYRYFLEVNNFKPTPLQEKIEQQLLVVCEEAKCEPLGHPLWEIAAFGRAEIAGEWQDKVGIRIFKLIHHSDSRDWIGKPAPKEG